MNISDLSDVKSESGVIGTLIYHPEYLLHTEYLKENHFYEIQNGYLYWAIAELYKDGINNIDSYNLSQKMEPNCVVYTMMKENGVSSLKELLELYSETARESLEEYRMLADKVVSMAFKREVHKTLNRMESYCFNKTLDVPKLGNTLYSELDSITNRFMASTDVTELGESIDGIWEEIERRRQGGGISGLPSKYKSFNEYFTYEPGELVVIQAKYKQGKSVIMMNEAVHKLEMGVGVLVIDTEMPTRQYVERLLSNLTGIEVKRIKNGNYSEKDEQLIKEKIEWLKTRSFYHIYDTNMSDETLYALCKKLKHRNKISFVVYDYLKSNITSPTENYNVLGAKCDFLKNRIAGELNLSVLAACQLNRNGEVADSIKINRYLSVGIKWEYKSQQMQSMDDFECGNAFAKVYINRLGRQMQEDDPNDYIDFEFDGDRMSIVEAKQHCRTDTLRV